MLRISSIGFSRERDIEEKLGHELGGETVGEAAFHKESFRSGDDELLGRYKLKLNQEHFLMVGAGGESNQTEKKTENIFGCNKQPFLASSGGLRLKSGGERPLMGEILRQTERQTVGGETPLGERQLATERLTTERMATERMTTERLSRVAFNEDRVVGVKFNEDRVTAGVKTKLSVDETAGLLSRLIHSKL